MVGSSRAFDWENDPVFGKSSKVFVHCVRLIFTTIRLTGLSGVKTAVVVS
jgi:hypothetical protein